MRISEKEKIIKDIFESANAIDSIEFLYTILRLEGPKIDNSDHLLKLKLTLQERINISSDNLVQQTSYILMNDIFDLIANLLRLINQRHYSMVPFWDLEKGLGYKPSLVEKIQFLIRKSSELGKSEFTNLLKSAYILETIEKITSEEKVNITNLRELFRKCRAFTKIFLNVYHQQRLKYKGQPQFIKIPGYQVFELLVNDEFGLYGFYSHYPSGGKSTCIRYPDRKEMINFSGVERVRPFVGLIPFDKEWLVNGKRLHELGLTGRYNDWGEWKPIVYPANYEELVKEARSSSPDKDVQGIIFYILTTGFKGIEFVVKTNINLPHQSGSIGSKLHLWKCPEFGNSELDQNICLYDGWFDLDSIEPDDIKEAIATIKVVINRFAFAYNGKVEWRVKYKMSQNMDRVLMPFEDDLDIFNSMLQDFPDTEDAIILDAAIDWYNRAKTANNIFASFLCYYVAIENVAQAIAEGNADFGLNYIRDSKSERERKMQECIEVKINELYPENPRKFIEQAYFDCVLSLKNKTKNIVELVFGNDHPYLNQLFKKNVEDKKSLLEIRSGIAHGSLSLLDKSDETLVAKRLPEIAQITKEFLTRLIFSIKPDNKMPVWSGNFTSQYTFADPRSTLIMQNEYGMIIGDDWKIRPEWVS